MVEGLHYFGDAGVHVPPVNVELEKECKGQQGSALVDKVSENEGVRRYQVDIGGLQLLQTGFH